MDCELPRARAGSGAILGLSQYLSSSTFHGPCSPYLRYGMSSFFLAIEHIRSLGGSHSFRRFSFLESLP